MPRVRVGNAPKDPAKVQAGREAARRRWGVQRYIHLDDFSDVERVAIVNLIDALRLARSDRDADS